MNLRFFASWGFGGEAPNELFWRNHDGRQLETHRPAIEAHYQFLLWLIPAVDRFPKAHKFVFGDRILSIGLDVLESLLAATFTRDRKSYLGEANLGIDKLRFFLRMATDFKFLDRGRYEHAARSLDEIGRLIGGWSKAHDAASA